jgi:hypothetical protein
MDLLRKYTVDVIPTAVDTARHRSLAILHAFPAGF